MYSRFLFVIFVTCGIWRCLAQDETTTETPAPAENMENDEAETTTVAAPPLICTTCRCSDSLVDCSDKQIRRIFSPDDIAGMERSDIVELNLSGNTIDLISELPHLPIQVLNISNSQVDKLDEQCFKNLENITIIDLSRNHISSLNKRAFWGYRLPNNTILPYTKMNHLNLGYNDLHSLPKDVFVFMHDLTFLDLSFNPLTSIDQITMGEITDLMFLKELRLSGCELETLPEGLLRRQRRLQRLDLSSNKFTTVPSALSEAVNLVYLNFDRNLLTALSERTAISSMRKLKELRLCRYPKLQSIGSGALGGLESLEVLHVCNNPKLRSINKDFLFWEDEDEVERWPSLKEFYLQNNNLTEINSAFLFRWDHLQNVDFSDNPFVCDCTNQWMVDVLVPLINTKTNATAENMLCNKPESMRGVTFAVLSEAKKTLTCVQSEEIKTDPGPNVAIILGIMIGVFAAFPLVLVIVLLWKKGYFARCRKKLNSEYDSDDENDAF